MSSKPDIPSKVIKALGLEETHPIYVAVPVGIVTGIVTLLVYRYWMGSSRQPEHKRKEVERNLANALQTVKDLEDKLLSLEQQDLGEMREKNGGKEIRIWMDGAFDMMHYGHMNAFRQGRALGTHLVVGVNSDETITACKGPPVCPERERLATVRGCKWVDEVVEGVPYVMSDEYLRYVIEKYRIDYVVHGDDPCIVDGKDVYESAVKMGKYLTIPRTEGISTTDIVGRMLLMTRDHHSTNLPTIDEEAAVQHGEGSGGVSGSSPTHANYKLASSDRQLDALDTSRAAGNSSAVDTAPMPFIRKSRFLTTSRTIRLFGAGVTVPKPSDRVVYLAGAWDMFHAGHIEILENARKLGDYVIVGVHNDSIVNQRRGMNLPIMNLHERVLSVLGCKWVDDVLIDAPYAITEEMIQSLRISVVVCGTVAPSRRRGGNSQGMCTSSDSSDNDDSSGYGRMSGAQRHTVNKRATGRELGEGVSKALESTITTAGAVTAEGDQQQEYEVPEGEVDAYAVPKRMGILRVLPCIENEQGGVLGFVQRIQNQRKRFTEKYQTKSKTENQYYTEKYKK